MSEVNNKQIGGDHYRSPVQHWDFVEINGLGYLEGCASKYATRNRKKHESPVEDLEKAIHYCEKLISLHEAGQRHNRRILTIGNYDDVVMASLVISVEDFAAANDLTPDEEAVVNILTFWTNSGDLRDAIDLITKMLNKAKKEHDGSESWEEEREG